MPDRTNTHGRRSMRLADSVRDMSSPPRFGSRYNIMEEDSGRVNHEMNHVPEPALKARFGEELFQAQFGQERATADRLIPFRSREACEYTLAYVARKQEAVNYLNSAANSNDQGRNVYCRALQSVVLGERLPQRTSEDCPRPETRRSRVLLNFQPPEDRPPSNPFQLHPLDEEPFSMTFNSTSDFIKPVRKFSKTPYKVLDAPGLKNDFYYNLIHWSTRNVLAVGLGKAVYMWTAASSDVQELIGSDQSQDEVSSVSWSQGTTAVAVGTRHGHLELWNPTSKTRIIAFQRLSGRLGCLDWNFNMLASGCRDGVIRYFDPRKAGAVKELRKHTSEICGLKWSINNYHLVSGGNENLVCVWDIRSHTEPLWEINEHKAAVKAVTWSPHNRQYFATGGGLKDNMIKIWNLGTLECVNSVNTGAQTCGLHWSENVDELVSTHGYNSCAIKVWKAKTMENLVTIPGHSSRIVYMAISPDGTSIATGAGDESVRLFDVFPPAHRTNNSTSSMRSIYESFRC